MQPPTIDQLRAKRGKVKSSLTRMETFTGSVVPSDTNYLEFKVRYEKIDECWSEFDYIQSQMRILDPGEEQEQEYENADSDFEEKFFKTKAKLFQLMEQAASLSKSGEGSSSATQSFDVTRFIVHCI